MVVLYFFGILLATAACFETLRLSPGLVVSNLQNEPESLQPIQALSSQNVRKPEDCPQNEVLAKIVDILNNAQSRDTVKNLDGGTKAYVLSLIHSVLKDPHNEGNNIANLNAHVSENRTALREAIDDANKRVKITIQYELPAENHCRESLEYLFKLTKILNDKSELTNFKVTDENSEQGNNETDQMQDKQNNAEALNALFDDKNTNVIGLLQNYKPDELPPVQNNQNNRPEDLPPVQNNQNYRPNNLPAVENNQNYRPNNLPAVENNQNIPEPSPVQNNQEYISFQEKVVGLPLSSKVNIPDQYLKVIKKISDDYNRVPVRPRAPFYNLPVIPNFNNRLYGKNNVLWRYPNTNLPHKIVTNPYGTYNYPIQPLSNVIQPIQSRLDSQDSSPEKNADLSVLPGPLEQQKYKSEVYKNGPYKNPNTYQNYLYAQSVGAALPAKHAGLAQNQYSEAKLAQFGLQGNIDASPVINQNDQVVEITYVLQEPKTVHYEPVYLIKYRLPMKTFEETVHKVISEKPHLKNDPNQLYQELLASLKLDGRYTEVTELKGNDVSDVNNNLINNNQTVSEALRAKIEALDSELKIIEELNSNLTSQDLLDINNGTVQDELRRLKRHHL